MVCVTHERDLAMQLVPYEPGMLEDVIRMSLRSWAPVFRSIQAGMDPDVYGELHPDWRVTQTEAVRGVCEAPDLKVCVALEARAVVGFVAVKLHTQKRLGEIYMIAVDPDCQRRGIGSALMEFGLSCMKDAGMSVAMVDTGGDPGHLPARLTDESNGFRALPIVRYFKKL